MSNIDFIVLLLCVWAFAIEVVEAGLKQHATSRIIKMQLEWGIQVLFCQLYKGINKAKHVHCHSSAAVRWLN